MDQSEKLKKSKLLQEILPQVDDTEDIHEQLIWIFLQFLLKGYHRVDIVGDTYLDKSIKSAQRIKEGTSSKVLIGSVKK